MTSNTVYECPDCGYHYNEKEGCEREGYPAGTKWDDLPEDFPCPDCFVREKPDFVMISAGANQEQQKQQQEIVA